jgi:hypothetical protein
VKVVLDLNETVGKNFEMIEDTSICAILVNKHGASGAVRLYAPGTPNVVTGPDKKGWVVVVRRPDQTGRFFLTPTVRYFRRA